MTSDFIESHRLTSIFQQFTTPLLMIHAMVFFLFLERNNLLEKVNTKAFSSNDNLMD